MMNKRALILMMSFGMLASLPALADDDLGINVMLEGEVAPGVYGRVELGNNSHPDIYYPQPMVIVKDSRYAKYKPVYLHVPPGHAKHWDKHCQKYHACNRPVYFVRSAEYDESYQREHAHDHDHDHDGHDNKKSNGKGHGNNGKGNGNNGKGKDNKH